MLVIGLTGGIATGKSTVSSLFKAHSIPVIDADVLAREVVEPGKRAHSQIVAYFGQEILRPDGTLDRPKLGAVIFNDTEKRKKLNSIVHPAVSKAIIRDVLWYWIKGNRICIVDVPLLIEGSLDKWVARVVVVSCPEDRQLERLMARDESEEEAAKARMQSQMPISEKVKVADIVLDNSGTKDDLTKQVNALIRRLEDETKWTWLIEWLIPPLGLVGAAWVLVRRAVRSRLQRKKQ